MTAKTNQQFSLGLPSPDERPDADVIIFDGQCRFCIAQITRLAAWDKTGRLAFMSLHDPQVVECYPDLTREQMLKQMYIVDRAGRRYCGADAVRRLSRLVPKLWIISPLLHIPFSLPLWQWCYRQIAKRRYGLGKLAACGDGDCQLPFNKR